MGIGNRRDGTMEQEKGRSILKRIREDIWKYRWVLPVLLLYDLLMTRCFGAFCPMVILTGLPCPGCGMTRALLCLLSGRFVQAFRYHPCIYLWTAAAVYGCRERYFGGRRVRGGLWLAGGIATVMVVFYLYRMMTAFPGDPPMVMKRGSLLGTLFPGYDSFWQRLFERRSL